MNAFEDELSAKLGVKECLQHDLLVPYPVMADKAGSFVAVFRTTVMITKGKTTALTGLPVDDAQFKTEHSIKDEQILGLLSVKIYFILSNLWTNLNKRKLESKSQSRTETDFICLQTLFYSFLYFLYFKNFID